MHHCVCVGVCVVGDGSEPACSCACVYRRVTAHTGLVASYGANQFLIKFPKVIETEHRQALQGLSFYGRLMSSDRIVGLDSVGPYISEDTGDVRGGCARVRLAAVASPFVHCRCVIVSVYLCVLVSRS